MRKLRRHPKPGRAGIVVPNGTLFGDGVCARIKEELLKEFNLHTIVRLPNGVFAPYTSIPTNLLFFDRSGPTKEIWYYEFPLPKAANNTQRPCHYNTRHFLTAYHGGRIEKRTNRPGRLMLMTSLNMTRAENSYPPISISKTPTANKIFNIFHQNN